MTDRNWDPNDYVFDFPDQQPYNHPIPIDQMSLLQKANMVRRYVAEEIVVDLNKCLANGLELPALLLALATVDYLAGYLVGHKSKRFDYIQFIERYLPDEYGPYSEVVYDNLRSGLMHNLVAMNPYASNRKSFVIVLGADNHLDVQNDTIVFSVATFAEDVRRAFWMYFYDLIMKTDENPDLEANFQKRFNRMSGLGAFMVRLPDHEPDAPDSSS